MSPQERRVHLAWLIWCHIEGYSPEDRVGMHNWMKDNYLTDEDNATRISLLAIADSILTEVPA